MIVYPLYNVSDALSTITRGPFPAHPGALRYTTISFQTTHKGGDPPLYHLAFRKDISRSRMSLSSASDMFQKELTELSPQIPDSPAPAYTALPHRDVDFYLAPLLNGQIGDIELETVDGKRFLVHKRLLEEQTTFFHI